MINILTEIGIIFREQWKGIGSLIFLKTIASSVPTVFSLDNGDTITNPYDIANTFNNYFHFLAETKKDNIHIIIFQMTIFYISCLN